MALYYIYPDFLFFLFINKFEQDKFVLSLMLLRLKETNDQYDEKNITLNI